MPLNLLILLAMFTNALAWFGFKKHPIAALSNIVLLSASVILLAVEGILPTSPMEFHYVEAQLRLDPLGYLLSWYILLLGSIVLSFSWHYLAAESQRYRFMGYTCLVIACALGLVQSANLMTFWLFWVGMGWSVFALLQFENTRRAKQNATVKRRISLLGDLCLLGAIALCYGLMDTSTFASLASLPKSTASYLIGILLGIAAMTKSVQFPVHYWLKKTLLAPTPASAIMHAGVVNAGGILLLKSTGLLSALPLLGLGIALVGTTSAIYGHLQSQKSPDIKQKLVYSTVSQMGYIFFLCSIEAYAIALVHIMAHGLVKASLFLNAASIDQQNSPSLQTYSMTDSLKALSLTLVFLVIAHVSMITLFSAEPSLWLWLGIVAISLYFNSLNHIQHQKQLGSNWFDIIAPVSYCLGYLVCCLAVHSYLDKQFTISDLWSSLFLGASWTYAVVFSAAFVHFFWQKRFFYFGHHKPVFTKNEFRLKASRSVLK